MKIYELETFHGGWFIGDFEPSILQNSGFEVSIKMHPKGELWDKHFHKIATEYNCLVSGKMKVNGFLIEAGQIFVIEPNFVVEPEFLENCTIVCIKHPGVINDKYVVE